MADISIDQARANMWIADVNNELEAVELVLKGVSGSLTSVAGTDDSIMEGIFKVGTAMENAWTNMCNNFKTAQSKLSQVIGRIFDAVEDVVDAAGALRGKIDQ